jgi:hypothetical protein
MNMHRCRWGLLITWFLGFIVPFSVLVAQTIFGFYGDKADEAWSWFLPTILPTLLLIVGVLVSDFLGPSGKVEFANRSMFFFALVVSILYLLTVSSTILVKPFTPFTPLEMMKLSNFYLSPFQGFAAAVVGVFFLGKAESRSVTDSPVADSHEQRNAS